MRVDMQFSEMVIMVIVCSISVAYAATGTASFYLPPYFPNACEWNYSVGFIAAASNYIWENKKACWKLYNVRCTGPTNRAPHPCKLKEILVEIVDYCQDCRETLNLSEEAFSQIANPDAGVVKIEYEEV